MRIIKIILIENEETIINHIIYENLMKNFDRIGVVIIIDLQV